MRTAVKARKEIPGGSDILIIARTDALQGYGMEEALARVSDFCPVQLPRSGIVLMDDYSSLMLVMLELVWHSSKL